MFKNIKQKLENLSATNKSESSPADSKQDLTDLTGKIEPTSSNNSNMLNPESALVKENDIKSETLNRSEKNNYDDDAIPGNLVSKWSTLNKDDLIEECKALYKEKNALGGFEKENERIKAELSQKVRRTKELNEQLELGLHAKRDLESSYSLMLDEKDELISVLRTQIQLLKVDPHANASSSADNDTDKLKSSSSPSSSSSSALAKTEDNELVMLKEKIQKLEALLSKCRETIKSNKEKSRMMATEKDELMKNHEKKMEELKSKYDLSVQEALLKAKEEMTKIIEKHNEQLKEKEDLIKELNSKQVNPPPPPSSSYPSTSPSSTPSSSAAAAAAIQSTTIITTTSNCLDASNVTSNTAATSAAKIVNIDDYNKQQQLLETRSRELIQVMEERSRLRKELANQRERFAMVLERYDAQMKVVQTELEERMRPGPAAVTLHHQIRQIMDVQSGNVSEEVKDTKGHESSADDKDAKTSSASTQPKEDQPSQTSSPPKAPTGHSSSDEKLELAEVRISRLLTLLQDCAKSLDEKVADEKRWQDRLLEVEKNHAEKFAESEESVKRLNRQITELSARENVLNTNLERTRRENEEIVRRQRSDMLELQKVVEKLMGNEQVLKKQMNDIKRSCDDEVARVNKENESAMKELTRLFQDNQSAVGDLFKELQQSKQQSNDIIKQLEDELNEKYYQLEIVHSWLEEIRAGKPISQIPTEIVFLPMPSNNEDQDRKTEEKTNGVAASNDTSASGDVVKGGGSDLGGKQGVDQAAVAAATNLAAAAAASATAADTK